MHKSTHTCMQVHTQVSNIHTSNTHKSNHTYMHTHAHAYECTHTHGLNYLLFKLKVLHCLETFTLGDYETFLSSGVVRPGPTKACAPVSTSQALLSPGQQDSCDSLMNTKKQTYTHTWFLSSANTILSHLHSISVTFKIPGYIPDGDQLESKLRCSRDTLLNF